MKSITALFIFLMLGNAWALGDPGDPVNLSARIWRLGSSVQVEVWNTTEVDVVCSGSVTMYTRSGRTQTEYYWEVIYQGMSQSRYYRLWDYRDEVRTVFDTIQCRER